MMAAQPTSLKDMWAAFPQAKPHVVEGQPTMAELLRIYPHFILYAKLHRVEGNTLRLMHLVVPQQLWSNYSPNNHPAQAADPGEVPMFTAGDTANVLKQQELQHAIDRKKFGNKRAMDQALALFDADEAQQVRDHLVTLASPSFGDAYYR